MPPIPGLTKPMCVEYYAQLTEEYSDILLAHLYGHTHSDLFAMIEGPNSGKPVGVVNISPSVIPTYNPTVRVFEYDSQSKKLINIHQYYANVEDTKQIENADFEIEYDALSAYGMASLSVEEWQKLFDKINTDQYYAELYNRYKYVSSV